MKLYGYYRSSAAYRCRIALNLKNISYDYQAVNLAAKEGEQNHQDYAALNPQKLVPTLTLDATDSQQADSLGQSLAIIEYLDEIHPDPPFLPANPVERAKVRSFALAIACDIHPLQNVRVLNYLRRDLSQDESGVTDWLRKWLGTGLAACEQIAASQNHTGSFVFGKTPGLADIFLVPQIFSARRFEVDTRNFPRLCAVAAHCETLPAFAKAHPSLQPDAPAS